MTHFDPLERDYSLSKGDLNSQLAIGFKEDTRQDSRITPYIIIHTVLCLTIGNPGSLCDT